MNRRDTRTSEEAKRVVRRRMIIVAIVVAILFVVWVELAVGLFGSPFAGS